MPNDITYSIRSHVTEFIFVQIIKLCRNRFTGATSSLALTACVRHTNVSDRQIQLLPLANSEIPFAVAT